MRSFALLLILVNVLFFVWAEMIDVRANDLDRVQPRGTPAPRIVLVNEAADEPLEEDEPTIAGMVQAPQVDPLGGRRTAGAAPSESGCTTVGPFTDLANASQAQATLKANGFEPRQRVEEGELWVGYWVSVRDLPTREAADEAMRNLAERGITDAYILPGTDPENVLSLGVFSDYQRAQRRANEIRALGLDPRVDDRKRTGSAYWLDVDLADPQQKVDMAMFQPAPGKIMRLELRACPQVQG